MDGSRASLPLEVHLPALRLAGERKRDKAAEQHMIDSSSTPCSLWLFLVPAEILSALFEQQVSVQLKAQRAGVRR